jgi:arylformamidase
MQLIDISQRIASGIVTWPGDQPFEPRWSARIEDGSSVNVGAVTMSTHTGTHADAPLHFAQDGATLGEMPLEAFVGPALVIDVAGVAAIRPEHIHGLDLARYPRLLFHTRSAGQPNAWSNSFAYFEPETIVLLGAAGVRLVGIDTPSVDPADSTDLAAHHALRSYGIANLENLELSDVAAGVYWLFAAPVLLADMDAAPVRAVLVRDERLASSAA